MAGKLPGARRVDQNNHPLDSDALTLAEEALRRRMIGAIASGDEDRAERYARQLATRHRERRELRRRAVERMTRG